MNTFFYLSRQNKVELTVFCISEKMDSGGMSLVIDENVANRAARIIQRAWRCWVNKAPFKWCKAMLYHADKSDTAKTLLKVSRSFCLDRFKLN